jgi:hypothetical protein
VKIFLYRILDPNPLKVFCSLINLMTRESVLHGGIKSKRPMQTLYFKFGRRNKMVWGLPLRNQWGPLTR